MEQKGIAADAEKACLYTRAAKERKGVPPPWRGKDLSVSIELT